MDSENLRKRANISSSSEISAITSKISSPLKLELLYDGLLYDVTDWVKKHPGGAIINMYAGKGEDATIAIQQFHHRAMDKVERILKCLPRRTPNEDDCKYFSQKISMPQIKVCI